MSRRSRRSPRNACIKYLVEVVDKADEDVNPNVDVVEDLVEACRGVKDMKKT